MVLLRCSQILYIYINNTIYCMKSMQAQAYTVYLESMHTTLILLMFGKISLVVG